MKKSLDTEGAFFDLFQLSPVQEQHNRNADHEFQEIQRKDEKQIQELERKKRDQERQFIERQREQDRLEREQKKP